MSEEITEFEYYFLIIGSIVAIPMVIDALNRIAELNAMLGG